MSTAAIALGMDRAAIRAGLFGFNGVLVGAAFGTFPGPDWDVFVMVWIVLVAAMSSVLHAALANAFIGAWKALRSAADAATANAAEGAVNAIFRGIGQPWFAFATLSFVPIKGATPKLDPVEVEDITTPEEHLSRVRGPRAAGVGRDPVPGVS